MEALSERSAYDEMSSSVYDRLHARFLRISGGEGQGAIEGAVSALLRPGLAILEAGCGTGRFARRLVQMESRLELTLLDRSPRLLHASQDVPARRVHGDITALPFEDGVFDVALALWAIEATNDAAKAISELVRVVRPDDYICLLFCARIEDEDFLDRVMRWAIRFRGTGRYIDPEMAMDVLACAGARRGIRLTCHGPAAAILAKRDTK